MMQIFLECLVSRAEKEGPMPVPVLETMDMHYKLSSTKNSEIRFRWNILCLRAGKHKTKGLAKLG